MTRITRVTHEFVEYMPDELREATIYISIAFGTAAHQCCCGCGRKVVTPITPTDWRLIFDGETISLDPSIGNWALPCQSHYWIVRNKVKWAGRWSKERIEEASSRDGASKQRYFTEGGKQAADEDAEASMWEYILSPFTRKPKRDE